MAGKRIVFVSDELPVPGVAGHLALNHALLNFFLARGYDLVLLLSGAGLPACAVKMSALFDPAHVEVRGPRLRTLGDYLVATPVSAAGIMARHALAWMPSDMRSLVRRLRQPSHESIDAVLGRFVDPAFGEWAADQLVQLQPDLVLYDTIFRAPVLADERARGFRSVLIAHDVFHRRHAALSARGLRLSPARLTRDEEAQWLRNFDVVIAVQPEEQVILQGMVCSDQCVITAPMPITAVPRPRDIERESQRFVFVGSDSIHNVDGMRWFLREVWPRITDRLPDARLDVCGSVGHALRDYTAKDVTLHGPVADLSSVLHRAACAIAPVLAGSGLKIKLLDYVAHGLSVVTTTIGVAGFERATDWPFNVADDADAFSREASRLGGDMEGIFTREQAAIDYCSYYSPERTFGELSHVL
ncbi:MAG: hypothetical protein JWM36_851 [Hyphomicrobiales bacterium]|jgi:hypothetical protein|nr:hypothetical protein [Hyphomicrobiales bacterium]